MKRSTPGSDPLRRPKASRPSVRGDRRPGFEPACRLDATFRDALRWIGHGASGLLLGCGGNADSGTTPAEHPGEALPGNGGSGTAGTDGTPAPASGGDASRPGSAAGSAGSTSPGAPAVDVGKPALDPGGQRPLWTTDTASGTVVDEAGFELLPCSAGEYPEPLYLAGLSPAAPPDYLEMVGWAGSAVESSGVLCGGASDVDACVARFEALEVEPTIVIGQIVQAIMTYYLQGTLGDDPIRVGTLPELQAFLGEIDTLGDAALWVESQGYNLACGASGGVARESGFDVLAFTQQGCDGSTRHLVHVEGDGALSVVDSFVQREPDPYCIVGRRPQGLAARRVLRSSLGEFFAGCAELEAASVPAFVQLARELEAHRAPRALVRRALRSASEEVRHARVVGALARRFGSTPRWPRHPIGRVRALEDLARENAVEGCVRETYGALVARHQQRFARDAAIARVYRGIAGDETRHAELSWDVARWAEPRLSRRARQNVARARSDAARALTMDLARSSSKPIDAVAGLPAPAVGHALAERLGKGIWRDGIG